METRGASVDVIVSYSRTDSDFVDRLESDLKAHNLTVWVDRRKLEGGQVWDAEIRKAIDQCRVLLMVISPAALASLWVTKEYRYALKRHKEVIPVRLYPTGELPPALQRLQWVDFLLTMNFEATYQAHAQDLLKAIDFHIERYNAGEAARDERQAQRDRRRGLRLAGGIALFSLLILLLVSVIVRIFFPIEIVKLGPVISGLPNAITLSADTTSPAAGKSVTLTATTNGPVNNTHYGIQIVDLTDGVKQISWCTSGSTCNVIVPGQSNGSTEYQAEGDQGNPWQSVDVSNAITVKWPAPPPPTSITLSVDTTAPAAGKSVTLTATTNGPVDNTAYGIQIVDVTDGATQIRWCTAGSICSVTVPGKTNVSIQYEAYVDQANPFQWIANSAVITVHWAAP
jgi:hypothetical protein